MFRAEQDQRLVDRFWGLDLFERNMHAEEHRLREQYRRRVAELNGYLAYTGAIKKFDNRFVDVSQAVQVKVLTSILPSIENYHIKYSLIYFPPGLPGCAWETDAAKCRFTYPNLIAEDNRRHRR